ncbi:protein TolA [Verruconis gallopava]|uniref:Protein TolA n=1 Tax=Verruconis gallopava TaxID=253628 RepID=A0A0D2AHD8_9PEZI|nr:protein TolA [Verruconis gallopava]KIW06338.1 protein TolA [Verruconis gallopava]
MDGHQAPPPPPPPPHGTNPKSTSPGGSGLPPGNYDIFIIPPHSAGSGFLYLPSLRPQLNSFIAGAASALFACWLWSKLSPMLKAFVSTVSQSGAGFGMLLVLGIVAIGAFFAGSIGHLPSGTGQSPGAPPNGFSTGGAHAGHTPPPPNGYHSSGPAPNGYPGGAPNGHAGTGGQHWGSGPQGAYTHAQHNDAAPPPQPQPPPPPPPPPSSSPPPPPPPRTEPYGARSEADGSERAHPRPRAYSNASASWQKAKEEQRRREEERKKEEEMKRKAEEEAKAKLEAERKAKAAEEKLRWERQRAREKEERERKERERQARERLEKAKAEIERARLEKEIKEKLEKEAAEAKEKAEKEAAAAKAAQEKAEREARAAAARKRIAELRAKSELGGSKFGVGERTNPYSLDPNDRTPTPAAQAARKYEKPTAQSYVGTSTAESYRPYDRHKHAGSGSSVYSESYAPSQSTAPSSAPPRQSGPYSTTDPDKVVIKAVYSFSDSFPKPHTSLVAGQDGVTDGLILKIGTEGMFVDDDVKGIGLREWDVKTWTMKSVESISVPKKSLYILRVTIKDAVKTNFVFVIGASEEWKAKKGVEVLKGGSLARAGLVSAMSSVEAQRLMNLLGW